MTSYKDYGNIFRILRKQRNFKLTSFQEVGICPSTVSNFENGKTKIPFDKLKIMLDTLSVTLEEYFTYLSHTKTMKSYRSKELIDQITNSILNNDNSNLETYQLDALQLQEYFLFLALKGVTTSLSVDEINALSDYLESLKYWRSVDLYTLYLSINILKIRQITYIVDGFFVDNCIYCPEHELLFFNVVCCTISKLITTYHPEIAKYFINCLSSNNFSHTMYTQNVLCFIKGYWLAKFDNQKRGIEQLQQSLNIFKKLGDPKVSKYYQALFDKYIQDINLNFSNI